MTFEYIPTCVEALLFRAKNASWDYEWWNLSGIFLSTMFFKGKTLAFLFVMTGFLSVQGGRVTTYLLCKWESAVLEQQLKCDCEKHLYEADGPQNNHHDPLKTSLKEKESECFLYQFENIQINTTDKVKSFQSSNHSFLIKGFVVNVFHPPIS